MINDVILGRDTSIVGDVIYDSPQGGTEVKVRGIDELFDLTTI